jgi:hypothetical protein
MKRRQAHCSREIGEGKRRSEIIDETRLHDFDAHGISANALDRRTMACVAHQQRRYRVEQCMLRRERVIPCLQRVMREPYAPRQVAVADNIGGEPLHRLCAAA